MKHSLGLCIGIFVLFMVGIIGTNSVSAQTTSEGASLIGSDIINEYGYTGDGIKIAIFGESFDIENQEISKNVSKYETFGRGPDTSIGTMTTCVLQGEPIPDGYTVAAKNECLTYSLLYEKDVFPDPSIGTAAAEVILDIAPDAELYLYATITDEDFTAAIKDVTDNNIGIILITTLRYNDAGPLDGTSFLSKQAELARDNGILWISPAGDSAQKHWGGGFAYEYTRIYQ